MNIAFVVNNFPPRTGGVEAHVHSLANELMRSGHNVFVVTLGTEPGCRSEFGLRVIRLREHWRIADVLGFPPVGTRTKLSRFFREQKIDVVSVHTRFFPMSYLGIRAAKKCGLPVILTEHGSAHVITDSLFIRWASRIVDHTFGRFVLRRADQVLGVSENVVDFVRELSGVDAEVFYNAIDVDQVDAPQIVMRPNHLVFVGRIVQGKGWEDFLELITHLIQNGVSVTGEIIGDGVDFPKLLTAIEQLDLSSYIQVRGRLSSIQVRQALQGATMINPTTLAEGFQTTLLEAIAESGRVVTYDVPGALLLQKQGAKILVSEQKSPVSLAEAVQQILSFPGEPVPASFMKQWSWKYRANQYVDFCELLVNQTQLGRTQD